MVRWLRKLLCLSAFALVVLGLGSGAAAAETRVALVIGNGGYRSLEELRNPPNDANDVAAALKGLGFQVTSGIDLDRATMQRTIAEFAKAAAKADVSLFYYSGHGLQVAFRNYLIPVDAELHSEADVYSRTVELDDVMKLPPDAKGIHLVFLDACRTNPLPAGEGKSAERPAGLARVGNAAGFLIAFATQPDNVAFDGAGRNSPFAQAVLGHLTTVGEDISSAMIDVRKDVIAATGGAQIPWENSSLTRQFYFAPGEPSAATPETLLWQLAGSQKDTNLLNIYLDRYPEGAHVQDVRGLLSASTTKATVPPVNAQKDVEELLWNLAKNGRVRSLVDLYLARYPAGTHAAEAQALVQSLPAADAAGAPAGVVCERMATHPRDATANTPGVELAELSRNSEAAISACRDAVSQNPKVAHYVALLARATAAAGQRDDAIRLYREAADKGDSRAMVSLGLLMETGDGLPKDLQGAIALYDKAAARGNADGAINLAVALIAGRGVDRDTQRAISLLQNASAGGSAIATYDLGVLTQQGVTGKPADALALFHDATRQGDPRGYLAAAILLDEGRGVERNTAAAADDLLKGVAADSGDTYNELTAKAATWSVDTVKAVQTRLKEAGYYDGPVNGRGNATLGPALKQWRLLGPPQRS